MRLGAFSIMDVYTADGASSAPKRYEEALQLARTADQLGYSAFWVAEHHFQYGSVLPSPPVWLAAAARETHRIRLGALVAVLPLHSPRELAEQYALADVLSGGRLEIGVGSGYVPLEFQGFQVDHQGRRSAFDRALPEFLSAMRGDPLTAPGAPDGRVSINVRPVQSPHPPVWVAAGRRDAIRAVAASGHRLALIPYATLGRIGELGPMLAEYRAGLPPRVAPRVLAALHIFIGPDARRAERALERFLETRMAPESGEYRAYQARHPELSTVRGLRDRGLVLFGSESEVRAQLQGLESQGVTDLAGIFDFGGLRSEEAVESLRRLAPVLTSAPAVDELPELATAPVLNG